MFEIFKFDLNSDGRKEIILRGKVFGMCGATGNCGFWIFEKKGKKYRKVLRSHDYADITVMGEQIQKKKTNGFNNILLKYHFSVSKTVYSTYKFDGRKYVERKCLVSTPISKTLSEKTPKWHFVSCKKYFKDLEN